jgi:DNA polymerase-3 subunit epsilon
MVSDAPIFDTISDKVLNYCLTVSLAVCQFWLLFCSSRTRKSLKWTAKTWAAEKIKPGMVSYSLGRLCQSLGIDLDNRHRAGDWRYGNLQIVSLDTTKEMDVMIKKTSQDQRLPPNLPRDFEQLPENQVYYYYFKKCNLRW